MLCETTLLNLQCMRSTDHDREHDARNIYKVTMLILPSHRVRKKHRRSVRRAHIDHKRYLFRKRRLAHKIPPNHVRARPQLYPWVPFSFFPAEFLCSHSRKFAAGSFPVSSASICVYLWQIAFCFLRAPSPWQVFAVQLPKFRLLSCGLCEPSSEISAGRR
jgi:hypothetical protein